MYLLIFQGSLGCTYNPRRTGRGDELELSRRELAVRSGGWRGKVAGVSLGMVQNCTVFILASKKSPVANVTSRLLHLTVPFGSDMIRDG